MSISPQENNNNNNDNNQNGHEENEQKVPLSSSGEPKGPPDACLFVASISESTDDESLSQYFEKYGTVLKVKLLKDKKNQRPYAFVQFLNSKEADSAVNDVDNHVLDGRHIRVEKAKVNRTLFIAKFSRQMTNSELRDIAEAFGPIENVTIIKNHMTQESKGCGFLKFRYREDAMDALLQLKQTNKKWVVEWANSANDPDSLGIDKQNIFIGGLSPKISREEVMEKFSQFGEVENLNLINPNADGEDQKRTAFAFLRYTTVAASGAAIEGVNGKDWMGRRVRVQYCETPEMKYRKRINRYLNYLSQYQPYYFNGNVPPQLQFNHPMQPPPMYNNYSSGYPGGKGGYYNNMQQGRNYNSYPFYQPSYNQQQHYNNMNGYGSMNGKKMSKDHELVAQQLGALKLNSHPVLGNY